MYCPSCGKEIGDNSLFCKFCGKPVSNDAPASEPTEWEYWNVIVPVSIGNNARMRLDDHSIHQASNNYWQLVNHQIRESIHLWRVRGWELEDGLGSDGLVLEMHSTWWEPIVYKAKMRIPKSRVNSQDIIGVSTLTVSRKSTITGGGKWEIKLDGDLLGTITKGRTQSYRIPAGLHVFYIRTSDFSVSFVSDRVEFSVPNGGEVRFHCQPFFMGQKIERLN